MIRKYKHVSFDLDGTLVHTLESYRHEIIPKVVTSLGGVISEPHAINRFWFEGNRDEIIKEHFLVDPRKFWDAFNKVDLPETRSNHTHAYVDAEGAIRKIKEMGKTVSIVTGAPHEIAMLEIAKLNGAPHDLYFSISSSEFNEKPDPHSLNFVMDKLKMKPHETLYIGNSNEDAFFAKNAGVDFVHINRNEHDFDLGKYAVKVIDSLEELFSSI